MDPTVSTDAAGVVHITAEFELQQEDEQEAQPAAPASDPVADVLSGVVHATGRLLGGIWDAIKPDDSQPAESEEE